MNNFSPLQPWWRNSADRLLVHYHQCVTYSADEFI